MAIANAYGSTCEIQDASMADCASPSRAVIAHIAPTSRPTACSVGDARVPVHNDCHARPQSCPELCRTCQMSVCHVMNVWPGAACFMTAVTACCDAVTRENPASDSLTNLTFPSADFTAGFCRARACAAAAAGLFLLHTQPPAHCLCQVRARLLRNLRNVNFSS